MSAKQKYHIKRTGRRCTRLQFIESDGTVHWLNAVGSHVWTLTPADAAKISALPDTRVRMIKSKPALTTPPPAPPPKKRTSRKKPKK